MAEHRIVFRPSSIDRLHVEQGRDAVAKSRKILARSFPDHFLGHKTQEAFPKEEDESNQG